jgi:hypothetical protein
MDKNQELSAIFRGLTPENQERLLDNARLSQVAENAVKKAQRRDSPDMSAGNGAVPYSPK